ncbi:hypothetical protein AB0M46_33305 [Dactylosporangium sp. NPDC051485]|uniref:hypothetical protein n=1 Tax=Dactylosporangium sp. NPDC051485 TaxID=3154846 RepID=UPI003445FB3F
MLWLTWRQHRWQLIGVAAILAVFWGYLVHLGLSAHQAVSGCPSISSDTPAPDCAAAINTLNGLFNTMGAVVAYSNLLPLAVGMFWGAPLLARELEQGTHRLAFTQSVSRRRWLAVKLGVLTGAAALFGAVTGAVLPWAYGEFAPMFPTQPLGDTLTFSQSGAVPAATWVFALLAGATAGLLLRRTMAAAAVTLVALPLVFAGLVFARPHYLPPADRLADGAHMIWYPAPQNHPSGWILRVSYVDTSGRGLDPEAAGVICADPANTYPTPECLDRTGLRQRIVYHPAGDYPWFQLIEVGLLLTASAAMALFIWLRITRRYG